LCPSPIPSIGRTGPAERRLIDEGFIEEAMLASPVLRDREDATAFNAIAWIPTTGRKLKVVYRRSGRIIHVISAYWIT
jgi:hypothetical protein